VGQTEKGSISMAHDEDVFARALTQYAMHASPKRLAQQLRQAYGDRYPGSHQRWLDQAPEREAWEQSQRDRAAWKLYRRVHGEPCAAELARLEFERQVKEKCQTLRPTTPAAS
jgi:hypothetical protein